MDKPKFIGCGTGCQVGAAVRYAAKLEAKVERLEGAAGKILTPTIRKALEEHRSQRHILDPANRLNTQVVLYLEELYDLLAALEGKQE